MKNNIFFIILFLCSCGRMDRLRDNIKNPTNKNPRKHNSTDPIFEPYISEFESYYGSNIIDIPINFAKLKNRKVGVCYSWDSGYREIEIDRDQWEKELTEDQKSALIFHELGHCELNRDHRDDLKEDMCPESIMNWMLLRDSCMKKYKIEYFEEIFEQLWYSITR